ncbi:MAG: inositol monophosphatase [Clostridia bacterium]|nr:inositol monophosphatase [Clostridia bacterium]
MDYNKIIDIVLKTNEIVFNKELQNSVMIKGDCDYLTAVDVSISNYLKEELYKIDATVSFMSEEDNNGKIEGKKWILDPIDGTTNLVYNYNLSSVSLAYYDGINVKFGVVYNPFTNELFYAIRGEGAFYNGKKLENVKDRPLKECLIEFGAGTSIKQYATQTFELAKQVFVDCLDLRRMCSSALAISYIASGKLNGYFERSLYPWDYAAAYLILSECGGIVTDFDGNKLQFDKKSSIVCGSPTAHKYLLEQIEKYAK